MESENELITISTQSDFLPGIQVEQALMEINDTFLKSPIEKVPFTEIASLGASFSKVINNLVNPAEKGLYRCVFPKGVHGALALAKDGSGALGTIMNDSGIVGQARWMKTGKTVSPSCIQAAFVAVAVLAVAKQINDIKDSQKEIIGILERDKKSQLLADYEILLSYIDEYRYDWENQNTIITNLNQVKDIKRNAQKDIKSYVEQIEEILQSKQSLLKMKSASTIIGKLLNRFIHYKLALNVYSLSEYMVVMLSQNYNEDYLNKVSGDIRINSQKFRMLYTDCYEKIEALKAEAPTTKAVNKIAEKTKLVGNFIGKIPLVEKGPVDELLIGISDSISDSEKKQLEAVLAVFIKYKDSAIIPIAEHIESMNRIYNQPVVMICDEKILYFEDYKDVV